MDFERRRDWRAQLIAYLTEVQGQPFTWGTLDCALFACGAVRAQTGVDMAKGWRGYRTAKGSLRKLRAAGFANVEEAAAAVLPRAARLRPGDIAVIDTDEGPALGVVQGRFVYAMTYENGLQAVPMAADQRGFTV
ncbi:MAG: hypothetical protein AAFN94_00865 [Pseudomonadota bacterium]